MPFVHQILRVVVPAYDVVYQTTVYRQLIHKKSFQLELLYRYIPLTFFFNWLFSIVPLIGPYIGPILFLLGAVSLYKNKSVTDLLQTVLVYLVVGQWGFLGLWSFVGHTFLAHSVAESIGWGTGSPFQIELAFYHLGLSLATFTLLWNRNMALFQGLIIAKSTFQFGAMGVHLYDFFISNNINSGNIGPGIIYADVILPLIVIYLFMKVRLASK